MLRQTRCYFSFTFRKWDIFDLEMICTNHQTCIELFKNIKSIKLKTKWLHVECPNVQFNQILYAYVDMVTCTPTDKIAARAI